MPYTFTNDWFNGQTEQLFAEHLAHLANKECNLMEIGCHEGRSTTWLIDNILNHKDSKIVAIDPFNTDDKVTPVTEKTYDIFLNNIKASKYPLKVIFAKQRDYEALPKFRHSTFDFIYIDGSHLARDVLYDAVNCWELLKTGGIMWFDDYDSKIEVNPPSLAINGFLACHANEYQVLHRAYQLGIKKL